MLKCEFLCSVEFIYYRIFVLHDRAAVKHVKSEIVCSVPPRPIICSWLPVQQRINYRISSFVSHCVLGNAPSYLLELFILTSACSGRRSLRSATKGDFLVPRARTATRQTRAFSIVGPSVWNDLPSELRSLPRDLSS